MISEGKKINHGIEILRGFSALIIVFFHIIDHHDILDLDYFPTALGRFKPSGQLAVLLFFVLSGYVIGVNHGNKLAGRNLWTYLKKRFVRIYPIYFIAILLGILVAPYPYPWQVIVANFTLTQNIVYEVLGTNGPAWSLNYEVLFYLLFIPVSLFNIKPSIAFIFSLIIGTINLYLPFNPLISAYAYGFCFWLSGLFIARNFKETYTRPNLPALLFYILGIGNIIGENAFFTIEGLLSKIKAPVFKENLWLWDQQMVGVNDLLFIPYCFMIVLFFAGKTLRYKTHLFIIIQVIPLFIVYRLFNDPSNLPPQLYISIAYLAIALLICFIRVPDLHLRKIGLWSAGISYGLYMIHYPFLFLFGRLSLSNDNLLLYIARVIIYLSVISLTAWVLEKRLQPAIRRPLMPNLP
ncbi:acyltransferase family protein [Flavitalea sp. BT771]|uniref:acyltransferase family protein n=1 Tax=Flavitalea sp. BT771 TaxID=3063329 RepID=UPI0034C6D3E9